MLSVKQGGIKYHVLSLWYDSTWHWTPVSRATGAHPPLSQWAVIYIYILHCYYEWLCLKFNVKTFLNLRNFQYFIYENAVRSRAGCVAGSFTLFSDMGHRRNIDKRDHWTEWDLKDMKLSSSPATQSIFLGVTWASPVRINRKNCHQYKMAKCGYSQNSFLLLFFLLELTHSFYSYD